MVMPLQIIIVLIGISMLWPAIKGAPWLPTSLAKVRRLLEMAQVGPTDTVYDLGCGDGRVIVMAARRFGARAVGIEISPLRFLIATALGMLLGLRDRVRVEFGDLHSRDLSEADVIFTYLLQRTNENLQAKLQRELRPGTRVISHEFTYPGWVEAAHDENMHLHLYIVGERPAPNGTKGASTT